MFQPGCLALSVGKRCKMEELWMLSILWDLSQVSSLASSFYVCLDWPY